MTRPIGVGSGKNRYETHALEVQVPRGTGELMKQLFIRLANANLLPYKFVPHGSIATVGPAAYRLFLAKHQKALDDTRVVAITGIHPNALFEPFKDVSEDPNVPSNLMPLLKSSANISSIQRTAKSSTQGVFYAITTRQQLKSARQDIDQILYGVYEGERTVLIHPDTPRPYRLDEAQSTRTCNTDSYVSKLMATQVEAASKPNHTPPYHHKAWTPKRITIISTAASNNSDFPPLPSKKNKTKPNAPHSSDSTAQTSIFPLDDSDDELDNHCSAPTTGFCLASLREEMLATMDEKN
jgi:hypothetical protein